MNILYIDACPLGDHSASRQFTAEIITRMTAVHIAAQVSYRDLAAAPLSHVSGPLLQVMRKEWNNAIPMNAELRAEALQSASLMQEFLEADLVVVAVPMYNYSVPSTLKAWLDRLMPMDVEQHAANTTAKRVLLAQTGCCSMGHTPDETMMQHLEAQMRAVFGDLGIQQLEVLRTGAQLDALIKQEQAAQPKELKAAA